MICVPSAITAVEKRAVTEAARKAGAVEAQLIEQPMAAAIGAGLPIHEPMANMVVDIGGGTCEIAVISLGGMVALEAMRVGGFDIDEAVQACIHRECAIAVGERTAEEVKLVFGSTFPTPDEIQAEVRGRELTWACRGPSCPTVGDPRAIGGSRQARGRLGDSCVAKTPPELAEDLLEQGIYLVGGGSMLNGPRPALSGETGVPVRFVASRSRRWCSARAVGGVLRRTSATCS